MTPFSKYQLGRRLGGGGMAEVFLASTLGAEGFQRTVAIKRVLPHFSENATFAQMFINEAQISSLLNHTNIVSTLDFDRDTEGRLFLVMEYIEGQDLDGVMEKGRLPFAATIHVIVEVLRGLGHAHDATAPTGKPLGIVHRDVSPHNVLLSWDGAVKVSDFGIAKAVQATNATAAGSLKGKAAYMSPEQVARGELDARSDLFAVGVMLHEMLTGEKLFRGHTLEEVLASVIMVAQRMKVLPRPSEVRPDVPPDLDAVTMALLEVDPSHRIQHARQAIDALQGCRDASPRGADVVAHVMAMAFPDRAPARRPSAVVSALAYGSGSGPVTPFAHGTPGIGPQVATWTPPPADGVRSSGPVVSKAPQRGHPWWLPVVLVTIAFGTVVALALILSTGGVAEVPAEPTPTPASASTAESSPPPSAVTEVAVTPSAADAGPAIVAAEPPPLQVMDAGTPVAEPPAEKASSSRGSRQRHRGKDTQRDTGTAGSNDSTGIQEVNIGGSK